MLVEDVFNRLAPPRAAALQLQQRLLDMRFDLEVKLERGMSPNSYRLSYHDENKLIQGWIELQVQDYSGRSALTLYRVMTPDGLIYTDNDGFDSDRIMTNLEERSMFKHFEQSLLTQLGNNSQPDQNNTGPECAAAWTAFPPLHLPKHTQVHDSYVLSQLVVTITNDSKVTIKMVDAHGNDQTVEAESLHDALVKVQAAYIEMPGAVLPQPGKYERPFKARYA